MDNKEYRELFLRKINTGRIITGIILGICIIVLSSLIIVYTFFGKQLQLPDYSYFLPLYLIQLTLFIAALMCSISFFGSYKKVLTVINDKDLETLKKIGESRFWLERYLPSFIIYSGKIRVFKWFRQPEFYFTELKGIKLKTNVFTRGVQNRLVIFNKLKGGTFFFAIDNNSIQRKHLLEKAVEYNPNIVIEGNTY